MIIRRRVFEAVAALCLTFGLLRWWEWAGITTTAAATATTTTNANTKINTKKARKRPRSPPSTSLPSLLPLHSYPGVDKSWLQEGNIVRVDRCQFSNVTADIHAPPNTNQSSLRVHQPFLWAWHGGECNGLFDPKWQGSGGAELIGAMRADAARLLRLGVLNARQRAAGSVAIDIGAHSGDSTVPMAMLANRTIAFDPNTDVFNILRVNAKINPHLRIEAHPLAIADADKVRVCCAHTKCEFLGNALDATPSQNLTFQYGWRVPKGSSDQQAEFRCNGGVSGIGGRTLPQLWVTKQAVQLEGFLRRTYGDDVVKKVKYIKIDAEVPNMPPPLAQSIASLSPFHPALGL